MWGFTYLQMHSLFLNCLCGESHRCSQDQPDRPMQPRRSWLWLLPQAPPHPPQPQCSSACSVTWLKPCGEGRGRAGLQHPCSGSGLCILAAGTALLLPEGGCMQHRQRPKARLPAHPGVGAGSHNASIQCFCSNRKATSLGRTPAAEDAISRNLQPQA